MRSLLSALLIVLLTAACSSFSKKSVPTRPGAAAPSGSSSAPAGDPWTSRAAQEPKLYARDGSIVGSRDPGSVAVTPNTGPSAIGGPGDGSRWTLLEQYQSAVQAKEALEVEVQGLSAALDAAEQREQEMTAELARLRQLATQYEAHIGALQSESVELASRLTTAQIRRLQSEKLLLEAKLDWKRMEATINQSGTTENADGSTPAPAEPEKSEGGGQ